MIERAERGLPLTADSEARPAPIIGAPESPDELERAEPEENIFGVLASRARTRATGHLWLTVGISVIDTLALTIARPSLWWVAAACVAVTGYAVWGLADRALMARAESALPRWMTALLQGLRGAGVLAGVLGSAAAVVGFLGAALGRGSLGW